MSASALNIIKANYEARASKVAELRSIDDAAKDRAYSPDEETAVTEIRSALESIDSRIQENLKAEIRSAEITDAMGSLAGILTRENGDVVDTRSLGQRFAQSDEVRSWATGGARGTSPALDVDMEFRAVTNVTTGATSGGALINNQRLTRVGNDFLDRRTFLMDLLPTIPVSTGSGRVRPGQHAARRPGEQARPRSPRVRRSRRSARPCRSSPRARDHRGVGEHHPPGRCRRPAGHGLPRRSPALRREASRRRSGHQRQRHVSPNLRGLLNRSGIVTYAPGAAEARYRSIRRGIRLMEDVEAVPEIIVLNPADAELFDL